MAKVRSQPSCGSNFIRCFGLIEGIMQSQFPSAYLALFYETANGNDCWFEGGLGMLAAKAVATQNVSIFPDGLACRWSMKDDSD